MRQSLRESDTIIRNDSRSLIWPLPLTDIRKVNGDGGMETDGRAVIWWR